jgi:hypothetical protein
MPFDYPEAGGQPPASGSSKGAQMLKPYKTTVNGYETTLLLSDEDAKAQGLLKEPAKKAEAKQAPKAANKSRTAKNKAK